ncbi:cytochrome P450 2G1 [Alligator mississippiensis]|uniref:cytochrome P450 2G1 n=1 Tax=Alligator mississippiensis TaxID=8496 RepID=UPI002877EAAF|nr:cytochrome P450 2G1 [Alligator mississippiensis]
MELGDAAALLLAACAACLMVFWEWKRRQRTSKLPPGPTFLELLGYLLQAWNKGVLQILWKVREKYGPVFMANFGMRQVVFFCDSDSVREALVDQGEEFSGRARMDSVDRFFHGHGVVMANGERWKQLRRFSASTLRNFGMGKKSIEERIQEESQYLVEEMGKNKGSPFDPSLAITHSIANIICSIVFGNRFDYKDQNFLNLMGSINNLFLDMSKISTLFYEMFPRIMPYIPGPHNQAHKHYKALHDFILERMRINQQSLDPSCPRDFIDSFLVRMEEEKQNPQSEFSTRNLVDTAIQLFFGGTETTSSTLRFGLLLLMKYPEVQDKVHEEIDHVIGRTHSPAMNDRGRMPYTNAVIHEIQRLANILPIGVPHKVTCDTHFRGYLLPKDTDVYMILGILLQDPKYFKDPKSFHPEHFLDEEGHFKRNDSFLPFGTGKRVCLGKSLALMELFLMLTTILQRFTLKSPKEPQEIDLTPKVNELGIVPPNYELYALPREEGLHDSA